MAPFDCSATRSDFFGGTNQRNAFFEGINQVRYTKLVEGVAEATKKHPSQVVRSIRELIGLPADILLALHQKSLETLMDSLPREELAVKENEIVLADPSDGKEVDGKCGFVIRCVNLPRLTIKNCDNFVIDLRGKVHAIGMDAREKFQITIRDCSNFRIEGGGIENARNGILVEGSKNFSIRNLVLKGSEGYGVIVFRSRSFEISDCVFSATLASGVYCLGDTSCGSIRANQFIGGRGYYNWDAGLHINHCTSNITAADIPENSHEDRKILDKVEKPKFIHVSGNYFSNNRAQGIYLEGCLLSRFENNVISRNNKEGICFDWGSALNYFYGNSVIMNGERASLSQAEIRADFIEQYPMLPDGSSSCKLPGVSIDNGALNILCGNTIHQNFGGGVKFVRAGIGNMIVCNSIVNNSAGRNEFFQHFYGVFLGQSGPGTEFKIEGANLDFMSSQHNVILENKFLSDHGEVAVMADPECGENYVSDRNFFEGAGDAMSENLADRSRALGALLCGRHVC